MLSTLREFKTKKNYYTIDAEKGKRVLVRVTFKYGNDDGILFAPVFDMLLDDNHWETVAPSNADYSYLYEAIYNPQGDKISICHVQTYPDSFPFISVIEVRSLELDMYNQVDKNRALSLLVRYNHGEARQLIS